MEKKIYKFKDSNKKVKLPARFYLGSISDGFRNTESREVMEVKNI